jgi:hypothetical protein
VKRFPSGFKGTVIGGGLFIAAGVLFLTALEKVSDPWSVSLVGEPALVGTWWGEMRTPTGRPWAVQLEMTATSVDNDFGEDVYMGGTAQVCDGANDKRGFELSGDADNWRGTRFHLSARQIVERQGELVFGRLDGEWAGDDMKLVGSLIRLGAPAGAGIDKAGNRTVSDDPDTLAPVAFKLTRGTEADFLAACSALSQGGTPADVPAPQQVVRDVPPLTQPVNDFANVIGGKSLEIERTIRSLLADTRDVIVVVTVKSMAPSTDIAQYSMRVFDNHGRGIGQAGADNGILVLLAIDERQVRITTGFGVDEIITDAVATEIIRRMSDHFRQNRIGEGLLEGVEELAARLRTARARQ